MTSASGARRMTDGRLNLESSIYGLASTPPLRNTLRLQFRHKGTLRVRTCNMKDQAMSLRHLLSLTALSLCLLPSNLCAQFAHTRQKEIVDGSGKPLRLRATNLGNWMVPEGYMWTFDGGPQSAREIYSPAT